MRQSSIAPSHRRSGQWALTAILLAVSAHHAAGRQPKMIGERATQEKLEFYNNEDDGATTTISTVSATYLGDCTPGQFFEFPISDGSVRGAIGFKSSKTSLFNPAHTSETITGIELVGSSSGSIEILGEPEVNFFAQEEMSEEDAREYLGIPFATTGVESAEKGATARVSCSRATPVIVIVRDDSGEPTVEATISCEEDGNSQRVTLSNGRTSKTPLRGQTRGKPGETGPPVSFEDASGTEIKIKQNHPGNKGLFLIQLDLEDSNGQRVYKTLIAETCDSSSSRRNLKSVSIHTSTINDDGDIELAFSNLGQDGDRLKVDARIGISLDDTEDVHDVVDMTAILSSDEPTMIVHGGWIRRAMRELGLAEQHTGWDIVVLHAVATDPQDKYNVVARMENIHSTGVSTDQAHRRAMLVTTPSHDEVNISDEMRQGRKPDLDKSRNLRSLSYGTHNKILVHGYCSGGNPFPTSDFTNAIEFSDPNQSRSHDDFAQLILAQTSNLHGCGCIAHSQGGAACLHLYTYYWSCLDYSTSGSRMIQSVGTPYQGTALAGNLAAIGNVFGVGCGTNTQLTYNGADAWLSTIPSWARAQVHYYTTSFEDKWWRYDYCSLATDLLLGDPEDGTTEKNSGQLSGANNMGHKTGQCHTGDMRDPHQCKDSSRNSVMNDNAKY